MDTRNIGSEYKTETSPSYEIGGSAFVTAILTAFVLIVGNIAAMWYLGQTQAADFMVWVYTEAPFAPFTGLVVFGASLTAGRYFGLKSLSNDNLLFAGAMVLLVEVTYAVFGAGVLSMYSSDLWGPALALSFVVVAGYTVAVTAMVYSTDKSFESWGGYAGGAFLLGIVLVLFQTMLGWTVLGQLAIAAFLIGFMLDLVFEVWQTSSRGRRPLANGMAVYVAFMGVFVHVLQFALQALGGDAG